MPQVLPPDDAFNASVGPAGAYSCLYFRALPWDEDVFTPPFGTGFNLTPGPVDAHMYSAWWSSATNAAMTGTRSGPFPNTQRHGCFVFRPLVIENVEVSAAVRHFFSAPRSTTSTGRYGAQAIGCRIRGGTHAGTDPQQEQRTNTITGYWFVRGVQTDASSGGMRWILLRVVSGAITVLAQNPDYPSTRHISQMGAGEPATMRMTARSTGTTVELRCYWTPHYDPGTGQPAGVEELLLSYDDISPSRIQSPGRVAIMGGLDNNASGFSSAPIFDWLQAVDIDTGALLLRDEFLRRNIIESLQVNKVGTFVGRSLAQQFFGDLWGTATPAGLRLQTPVSPSVGAATVLRITENDLPVTRSAYFLAQREADDNVNQDRSIDFFFESTGATNSSVRRVSVCLRESGSGPTAGLGFILGRAYEARATRIDSPASSALFVFRKLSATLPYVPIAQLDTAVPLDTWQTLRLVVDDVTGPNFGHTDTPRLKLYLDGVLMPLLPGTSTPSGVFFDPDGTIYDETADRIRNGSGEGFGVRISTGIARATQIDNWTQGAGAQQGTTPEDQQQTIVVSTEKQGATGTLSLPADWSVQELVHAFTIEHEFETGHVWRGLEAPGVRRVWEIAARAERTTDVQSLRDFFDAHRGVEIPFSWTTPRPMLETVTVTFEDDALRDVLVNPTVGAFSFRLTEAL